MAAVIDLKVKPEILEQKADIVSDAVSRMKKDFTKMETAIRATHGYWIGEAGDLHRKLYEDRLEDINEILKRFSDYPLDLLHMAGIYTRGEETNKQIASNLNGDVIH